MRIDWISPTTVPSTRGLRSEIGVTPSRVEQNRRRRSTSSWVSGTVSRWNSFFRAMADPVKRLAGVSVDGVVVAHDDAHCGSLVRGRKLDLVDQGPNERN